MILILYEAEPDPSWSGAGATTVAESSAVGSVKGHRMFDTT